MEKVRGWAIAHGPRNIILENMSKLERVEFACQYLPRKRPIGTDRPTKELQTCKFGKRERELIAPVKNFTKVSQLL
jgi:hypothetical protein